MPEQHRYLRELRTWVGFPQIGIPIGRPARYAERTKYNPLKLFKLAFDGIFTFSIVPLRAASILVRSVLCLRDLRKVLASVATGFHRFDTDDYLPVGHESVLPGDYRRIHRASVRGSERPSLLGGSQGDPPTHFWQPGGNTTDRRIRRGEPASAEPARVKREASRPGCDLTNSTLAETTGEDPDGRPRQIWPERRQLGVQSHLLGAVQKGNASIEELRP